MPLQIRTSEPAGTTSPEAVLHPEGCHEHHRDSDEACISPLTTAETEQEVPHGHQPGGISGGDTVPSQAAAIDTGTSTLFYYILQK